MRFHTLLILLSWRVNDYPEHRNSPITSGQSAHFLREPMDRSIGRFLNLKSQSSFTMQRPPRSPCHSGQGWGPESLKPGGGSYWGEGV